MPIQKTYEKAEAVLAVFEAIYGDRCDAFAGTYRNGREKGFSLEIWKFDRDLDEWQDTCCLGRYTAIFSEFRRSDNIVVYVGRTAWDTLTDEMYADAKFFGPDAYVSAARYIWKKLTARSQWAKPREEDAA
jgi:hypothetical protein